MIEAGVAYFQGTGKRRLLEVVCRLADHIDSVFGPGETSCTVILVTRKLSWR
jgi:DUF1680 family protein